MRVRWCIKWEGEEQESVDKIKGASSCSGTTERLEASCDEQVKWGENNTLVIKDNLQHCNFSGGDKFSKLYFKQMKK